MNISGLICIVLICFCYSCTSTEPASRIDPAGTSDTTANEDDYFLPQHLRFQNFIYEDQIKSVQIRPEGAILGPPLINLGSEDRLSVTFDDLGAEYRSLSYTFIHCSADWKPSALNENEYMEGFHQDFITDYKYSFNTLQRFISYRFSFPNDNIRFTKSGNYLLVVFDGSKEKPLMTLRFMIAEQAVSVEGQVNHPSINIYRYYKHEVDFTIYTGALNVQNPFADIYPVILQNYRWDNAVRGLKPLFVKDDQLIYDYDEINNFPGGNEYREFDIRNLRYNSEYVASIRRDSVYQVYLVEAEPRQGKRYLNREDINGHYVVRNYNGTDDRVESDYARVHFRLNTGMPLQGGQLYVFGELCNWRFTEDCKLTYDLSSGTYGTSIYLKQGYYNYQYMMLPDTSGGGDPVPVEGMHFDTEVPYAVLVYFRPAGARYDRLAGYSVISSRR